MAGYGDTGSGGGGIQFGGSPISQANNTNNTQTVKSISYKTGSDKATQLFSISKTASSDSPKTPDPNYVLVENIGRTPVTVACGYEGYTSSTADIESDATKSPIYVHSLLLPGQSINPPVRSVISLAAASDVAATADNFANQSLYNLDGTVQAFTAPNTNLRSDSGATLAAHVDSPDTTITVSDGDYFRIGDLIQLGDDSATASKIEIMEVTEIAGAVLTVTRGLFGSNINDKDAQTDGTDGSVSGAKVTFPFFNEYYDYDRTLSGSSQLVQTDSSGNYVASNFFGYGRSDGTAPSGITPGSVCFKFYTSAYQEVQMGGATSNIPIISSTSSKLAVSTDYGFDLTIDDSAATAVSFTTDTSNVNFGGTSGVINKMQTAINTLTRTTGGALYGYDCSVGISNGKLRFMSNSHLLPHDGTNGAKILLADNTGSGANLFSGSAGIFPDDALINEPVIPRLPDNVLYDRITYATTPNTGAFAYDDGKGNINGVCGGVINYETGAFSLTGAPTNASFEISVAYNGPFSGKKDTEQGIRANTLIDVYANTSNKYISGSVRITTI